MSMGKIHIDDGRFGGHLGLMSDGWRKRLADEIGRQDLDMKALSVKAGLGPTYVRDALKRGRGGKVENLKKLAEALGVSYEWLATGAGTQLHQASGKFSASGAWFIPILGKVAAGTWLEQRALDSSQKRANSLFPPDPRFPIEAQFDLVVEGESLNRFARDGDLLRCVDCERAGIEPRDGDLVIVKRTRENGDVETTAKRLFRRNSTAELRPESDDPHWQAPLIIDRKLAGNGTVSVTAVVLYGYKPARK